MREMSGALRCLLVAAVVLLCPSTCSSGARRSRSVFQRRLQVMSIEKEPYVMRDSPHYNGTGHAQYIGFIPDVLDELADKLGFSYDLRIRQDGAYGVRLNDGSWNGLISDLLAQRADVAASPMYVTEQRKRVVDFTLPLMSVQATVLLRKPPAGTSHFPVRTPTDLINQSEIKYGTLGRGMIYRAFQRTNDTALKLMWRTMSRGGENSFTDTNQEGIDLVRSSKYAFILPDNIGEYLTMREPCDLMMVGRFLMEETFALALPKGSSYLAPLNQAIRRMHNTGSLARIRRRWWQEKGECGGVMTGRVYSTNTATRPPHTGATVLCALLVVTSLLTAL